MSFPEAVKQVLFGGVVPSGLARAPLPSHRRVLPNGSVSFLTLIFFLFVPFIASRKLSEVWRSVSVSPFCAVASSLICSGGLAIGALLICHLVWALSGDGGGGYTVEEAIGFLVGIGRRAGRRFELERGADMTDSRKPLQKRSCLAYVIICRG